MERNHSASSRANIFRERLISDFTDWLILPNFQESGGMGWGGGAISQA